MIIIIKAKTNFLYEFNSGECSTLDALMARWPSMHARLKGMKPHLPKKTDNRPTLGNEILFLSKKKKSEKEKGNFLIIYPRTSLFINLSFFILLFIYSLYST